MTSHALRIRIAAGLTAVLLVAIGLAVGRLTATAADPARTPGTLSAEAGFARDMQTHHDQAVRMAIIVRDATDNTEIRALAYDIATSQAQQSGQMFGWLATWGLPQNSPQPPMSWMREAGHQHAQKRSETSGRDTVMPGMASEADLQTLQNARGVEAESLFLTLMIAHHRGGVEMAEAVVAASRLPVVTDLAGSIITAQKGEIVYMSDLLAERQ